MGSWEVGKAKGRSDEGSCSSLAFVSVFWGILMTALEFRRVAGVFESEGLTRLWQKSRLDGPDIGVVGLALRRIGLPHSFPFCLPHSTLHRPRTSMPHN